MFRSKCLASLCSASLAALLAMPPAAGAQQVERRPVLMISVRSNAIP
ncbi:hypothetical protein BDD14_3932 [Edaphobacter modestus]|uniref:Uncharacterized protein n=1 Tax=Edaphobacter modestus TaxID=388466 RepID=A0A4Q7YYV1_9BACT|nr:hypothetical protein BDD14_3932 [Edaphobacter modestus]